MNIFYMNLYTLFNSVLVGVASGPAQTILIYLITDSDSFKLGMATGVQGMAVMAGGILLAPFIDKMDLPRLMRTISIVNIFTTLYMIFAIYIENYTQIVVSAAISGFFAAPAFPVNNTIMSNSVDKSSRTNVIMNNSVIRKFGFSIGPLLAACMFFCLGNDWKKEVCMIIVCTGMVLLSCSNIFLLFYSAEYYSEQDIADDKLLTEEMGSSCCNSVLFTLTVHNVIISLASGMSIRYFPIFLMDLMHFNPVVVQLITFGGLFMSGVFSQILNSYVVKYLGNVGSMVVTDYLGVMFFFVMLYIYDERDAMDSTLFGWCIAVSLCLRTSIMNSSYGLDRSITMDHTPKEHRGKWNAIDTFYQSAWCGSAMFGGDIIRHSSLIRNFYITAIMQLCGVSVNLLLFKFHNYDKKQTLQEVHQKLQVESDEVTIDDDNKYSPKSVATKERQSRTYNYDDDNDGHEDIGFLDQNLLAMPIDSNTEKDDIMDLQK